MPSNNYAGGERCLYCTRRYKYGMCLRNHIEKVHPGRPTYLPSDQEQDVVQQLKVVRGGTLTLPPRSTADMPVTIKRKAGDGNFTIHQDAMSEKQAGTADVDQHPQHDNGEEGEQAANSEDSDDDGKPVDSSVAEDMEKFRSSFRGLSRRYRLIKRIGEGIYLVDPCILHLSNSATSRDFLYSLQSRRHVPQGQQQAHQIWKRERSRIRTRCPIRKTTPVERRRIHHDFNCRTALEEHGDDDQKGISLRRDQEDLRNEQSDANPERARTPP